MAREHSLVRQYEGFVGVGKSNVVIYQVENKKAVSIPSDEYGF
jgi:hypothetical protein